MPLNLSFTHIMVVGIVALVVLGPERLPGVARTAGSVYREWKRIRGDLEGEVREAISEFREPFLEHFNEPEEAAPPLTELPPLVGAAGATAGTSGPPGTAAGGRPLAAALPVLGPGSGLVSPGPDLQVELPDLGPPPEPGTFVPYQPDGGRTGPSGS